MTVLEGTSVNVPGRTKGRKTRHTERWPICHLLSTLAPIDALAFPLSLLHTDKPDFILELNENQYGIEITESIPQDFAKCCAMAERENREVIFSMSLFKWGSPEKSTEELKKIISSTEQTGDGGTGHSDEVEWANYIHDAISTKLDKLNNSGYKELPEYWLSIYDNLPLMNVHAIKATEILLLEFSKKWKGERVFTRVFIEKGPIIIDIDTVNNTVTNHEIVDLWS